MGFGFNATFLIQMLHFCGAYFLFYRLLFKPALAIINKEKESTAQLTASIEQSRLQLEECKQRQRHHWMAARNYFRDARPTAMTGHEHAQSSLVGELEMVSDADVDRHVNVLTDTLVSTLENQ